MRAKYDIDPTLTGAERTRARKLAYYHANRDKVLAQREANKEGISAQRKKHREANAEQIKARQLVWREANREYAREKTAAWRAEDPQRNAASKKAYYEAHKAELLAKQQAYASANAEQIRAYHRDRYQQMPELYVAAAHRRRARKLLATPTWDDELTALTSVEGADLVRRRNKTTGIKWHVDHVIPLRGKTVSGLHVWNNLQVIPAAANLSKANAFRG